MSARVEVYPWPSSWPRSAEFELRVGAEAVPVLCGEAADFAGFGLEGEVPVEVQLTEPPAEAKVRPLSLGVTPEVDGRSVRFRLPGPAKVCLDVEGMKHLYVFADPPEPDPPEPDDPAVHHFAAGRVHEVGDLTLSDGETLYVEGGGVLRGRVRATDAEGVTIRGRGILDGLGTGGRLMRLVGCRDVRVRDVTFIRSGSWNLDLEFCDDVLVENVKQIGWGNGSDGVDVVSSRRVAVRNCFLRNGDDCVAVKARSPEENPGRETDVRDVLVEGCTIVNWGAGNALEIGHELRTPSVGEITFRDIDILYVEGYGAAFSIHNSDRASVPDVLYEDIRVEHYFTFLIDFRIIRSRWSKDEMRGRVRDVALRDIRVRRSVYNPGYSVSLIGGHDPEHTIDDVTIENLFLDGQRVSGADDLDLYLKHASGVRIC